MHHCCEVFCILRDAGALVLARARDTICKREGSHIKNNKLHFFDLPKKQKLAARRGQVMHRSNKQKQNYSNLGPQGKTKNKNTREENAVSIIDWIILIKYRLNN